MELKDERIAKKQQYCKQEHVPVVVKRLDNGVRSNLARCFTCLGTLILTAKMFPILLTEHISAAIIAIVEKEQHS